MSRNEKADDIPRLIVPKDATLEEIYAIARKEFTAADLQKFTEIEPTVSFDDVLADMEQLHREESRRIEQDNPRKQ